MPPIDCIGAHLEHDSAALGSAVPSQFPPLHLPSDPVRPARTRLRRQPFPAQRLAIMGTVRRWQQSRCAAALAECGTGKPLVSLVNALAMIPLQLVEK